LVLVETAILVITLLQQEEHLRLVPLLVLRAVVVVQVVLMEAMVQGVFLVLL
jgi:hypothetical protein